MTLNHHLNLPARQHLLSLHLVLTSTLRILSALRYPYPPRPHPLSQYRYSSHSHSNRAPTRIACFNPRPLPRVIILINVSSTIKPAQLDLQSRPPLTLLSHSMPSLVYSRGLVLPTVLHFSSLHLYPEHTLTHPAFATGLRGAVLQFKILTDYLTRQSRFNGKLSLAHSALELLSVLFQKNLPTALIPYSTVSPPLKNYFYQSSFHSIN